MALVKKQTNSARLLIIGAAVIAVAGVGLFLFQKFFLAGKTPITNSGQVPGQQGVMTNFGEDILNDSRYTKLQPYGTNLNVNANDNPGQPNPFQ